MEAALEAGAEDVVSYPDGSIDVLTDPTEFEEVRDALAAAGFETEEAEVTQRASTSTELNEQQASSMMKMLEVLEDLDDVQNVYSNADIPDEILALLG
jgi:transcriptional/translational regulatory protein YebC/TACO1